MTTPTTAPHGRSRATTDAGDAATLSGVAVVDRIFFRSGDFFVASVKIPSEAAPVTLKGRVGSAALFPGSRFDFAGRWVNDKKFGPQIDAHRIENVEAPADEASVAKALATLPGIGPAKALAIIKDVGGAAKASTMLADSPESLLDTPTFAKMPAAQREDFRKQVVEARLETTARAMMAKLGFMAGTFASAVTWAGDLEKLMRALTERPYSLAKVRGISFHRLDESLIKAKHAAATSPARADGVIEAAFDAAAEVQGHTALTETMLRAAIDRLKLCRPLDEPDYAGAVRRALGSGRVVSLSRFTADGNGELGLLSGADWYRAEERVARMVAVLFERWRNRPLVPVDEPMPPLCDPALDDAQRQAVETMFRTPVSVLTGGAGTGKTRLVKALLALARSGGVLLAAPTGKAARRISEVTGEEALTIHRASSMLTRQMDEAGGGSFGPATIIIDESSMISSDVMDLLAALVVEPRCNVRRVVFVGDDGQLPPVGPGAPMRDLMECGRVAVEKLARTYRQHGGAASSLLSAAAFVARGESPALPRPERVGEMIGTHSDFVATMLVGEDVTPAAIRDAALDLYWRIVEERGASEREIILLVPQRTGRCGSVELNDALRRRWRGIRPDAVLDADGSKIESDRLMVDDRVVWTSNHYDCGAMNGDIGTVVRIETAPARRIIILLDSGQTVVADTREHFLSLRLAYALTVHRSQGSEWPYVVTVLSPDHHTLLSRRLVYVALTRARILGAMASSRKALGMALSREMPGGDLRSTALPEILARTVPA